MKRKHFVFSNSSHLAKFCLFQKILHFWKRNVPTGDILKGEKNNFYATSFDELLDIFADS